MELKSLIEYKKIKQDESNKLQGIRTDILNKKGKVDRLETEYASTEDNSILKQIQKLKGEVAELETREGILRRKKVAPHEVANKVYEDWKAERSKIEEKATELSQEADKMLKEAEQKYEEMKREKNKMKLDFAQVITKEVVKSGCIDDMTVSDSEKSSLRRKSEYANF